ncbi:TRAP transporter small permease [Rhizobium sp. CFBP 8762]|uniref:TRAP transporter small permease n=1 Tax=Rhizobium sp. CFBP 8762 TaxID=2775279 RepID=UPI00178107DE|nr:TRAP transporter small permease [Rhizobium sp. CFBP 8762]MBD8554531.1 TRAP transporter small permease [Rhizobium sp. CFBP 8762]
MNGPDETQRENLSAFAMVSRHPLTPMLRLANGLDRVVSLIARAIVLTAGCALLLLLFSNVVARYALGGGFSFAQEMPERIFPFFIMAGVALGVQHGGHMAVEMLPEMLGRRAEQVFRIIAQTIVIIGHAVLVYVTFDVASLSWIDVSPVLNLPASYSYYALTGGSAAVIIATLALVIRVTIIGPEAMPVPTPEETGQ